MTEGTPSHGKLLSGLQRIPIAKNTRLGILDICAKSINNKRIPSFTITSLEDQTTAKWFWDTGYYKTMSVVSEKYPPYWELFSINNRSLTFDTILYTIFMMHPPEGVNGRTRQRLIVLLYTKLNLLPIS